MKKFAHLLLFRPVESYVAFQVQSMLAKELKTLQNAGKVRWGMNALGSVIFASYPFPFVELAQWFLGARIVPVG